MSTPCTPLPDCTCAPGIDQEIIFNEATCLSTDPRFLWDYSQGLLSVDGAIAASGYIASSNQIEGSFVSMQALGTGSFNFTPTSGFGGLLYRGGSQFYYWNNNTNTWDGIDFGGEIVSSQIIVEHNGTSLGAFSVLNFVDNSAGVWSLTPAGNIQISLSTTWTNNVNANNFGITGLSSINGNPAGNLLFNPLNQTLFASNNNIVNVNNFDANYATVHNNLTVQGEIIYQGQVVSPAFWSLNADGSIYRNSNVTVNGSYSSTTKLGPFNVSSTNNSNFLFLNTTGTGANEFAAFAVSFDNVYGGELGFSQAGVELWTGTQQLFQAYADGHFYFPGRLGLGVNPPNYALDVGGSINASSCLFLGGIQIACSAGAAGANLTNVININGIPVASFSQTPWLSAINGGGFPLNNAGPIYTNGITVAGSINISGQYLINNVPVTSGQPQTPWAQNINGNNMLLGNVAAIGIGVGAGATIPLDIVKAATGGLITAVNTNGTGSGAISLFNDTQATALVMGVRGTASASGPLGMPFIDVVGNNMPLVFTINEAETMRIVFGPKVGIATTAPNFTLDVFGTVNAQNCYYIQGVPYACPNGSGAVNLSNISLINGNPVTGGQPQTPWAQDINGNAKALGSVAAIGIGIGSTSTNPSIALDIVGSFGGNEIAVVNNNQSSAANIFFQNSGNSTSLNVGIPGTSTSSFPGLPNINFTGTNTPLIFSANNTEVMRLAFGPRVGIGQSNPQYALDVAGGVNATGCYVSNSVAFACSNGAGGINLSNIALINGNPVTTGGYTPVEHDGIVAGRTINAQWGPFPQFRAVSIYFAGIPAGNGVYAEVFLASAGAFEIVQEYQVPSNSSTPVALSLFFYVPVGARYLVSGPQAPNTWYEWY